VLNYLPIVPKAFVYVPKVMRKPVVVIDRRTRVRSLNYALTSASY
jgi:hypothetical protein